MFGAVEIKKRDVSCDLMAVYMAPQGLLPISEQLRKRVQGRACFNFTRIAEGLLAELSDLTRCSMTVVGSSSREHPVMPRCGRLRSPTHAAGRYGRRVTSRDVVQLSILVVVVAATKKAIVRRVRVPRGPLCMVQSSVVVVRWLSPRPRR